MSKFLISKDRLLPVVVSLLAGACGTNRPEPKQARPVARQTRRAPKPKLKFHPIAKLPRPVIRPRITVLQEPGSTELDIRVVFRAGSADDPKGKEGLTCLAANLMAEGGAGNQTWAQIIDTLYPMSGRLSVQCGKDVTVISGRVHRDFALPFMAIFQDILLRPKFEPKAFDRVKKQTLDEIQKELRYDSDEDLGKAALEVFLYQGHPYGRPADGTVTGLNAITLDDVKAQAKNVFVVQRVLAGLAGTVRPVDRASLEAALMKLPSNAQPRATLPPAPSIKGLHVLVVDKKSLGSAISIGLPIDVKRSDPDFAALALAASYLGEHRQSSGVLYHRMRTLRGLNYGDYAYTEYFHQVGWGRLPMVNVTRRQQFFSIWIRPVDRSKAHFALRFALRELARFIRDGIPPEKFDRAKRFLAGYSRLWVQTPDRRLGFALDARFYHMGSYPTSLSRALATLTPEQVKAAVARHWSATNLKVVVVASDASTLANAIRKDQPSPITYDSPKPASILAEDRIVSQYPLHPIEVKVVPVDRMFQ
ncbi:MAG: insulinase family protein [Deltaproteobacteria bacterium]|nr:insulinase family protein [Deltaproteobacteria bacterium]